MIFCNPFRGWMRDKKKDTFHFFRRGTVSICGGLFQNKELEKVFWGSQVGLAKEKIQDRVCSECLRVLETDDFLDEKEEVRATG